MSRAQRPHEPVGETTHTIALASCDCGWVAMNDSPGGARAAAAVHALLHAYMLRRERPRPTKRMELS